MKSLKDNKHLLGLLKTIKLKCRLQPFGCKEIMDYDQFEVHENECGTCKECQKFGIIKTEMLSHHIDECTEYPYNCFFCGYEGNRVELTKKHRCY